MAADIDVREIQLVQLELLKEVHNLCERHGLRYILYVGTLLGAVRHKGFIPWDDDIDIAMPYPDYRKFLRIARELPEKYVVQSPYNTRHSTVTWTKVYVNGTTYMPEDAAGIDVHWGIGIDVYPIIGIAKTERGYGFQSTLLKTAKYLRFLEYAQLFSIKYESKSNLQETGKKVLDKVPLVMRSTLSNGLLRLASKNPDKTTFAGTVDAAPFGCFYARDDWDERILADFEDCSFYIPAHFDKMLTINYGDYMQLPPEEKRVKHFVNEHCEIICDTHRDYREYQREILARKRL